MTPAARFADGLVGLDGRVLGLAVSGGGDSMAMLHLAAGLGLPLRVVTVDHGLRPEAATEAVEVGRICAGLGLAHDILHWKWDERGNLQDAARRGRRALMAGWALRCGVAAVAFAHTRDDVAETFLMRLARGAGVDGLAAMAERWNEGGVLWLRPLLGASRDELRTYLRDLGVGWVEDPSNDNDRFERVRVRKALTGLQDLGLQDLGLTVERLAEVAGHLADARTALERVATDAFARIAQPMGPALRLDTAALAGEVAEVQRRVIGLVIARLAPGGYAPRGAALLGFLARVLAGQDATLAGVRFQVTRSGAWAYREVKVTAGDPWDGRWRIVGKAPAGAEIRALGEGIALCKGWRDTGLPRAALLTSPALWLGDMLIAAPHAGFGQGYSAISLFPAARLHHSALSH